MKFLRWNLISLAFFLGFLSIGVKAQWILKTEIRDQQKIPVGLVPAQINSGSNKKVMMFPQKLKSLPFYLVEQGQVSFDTFEETYWPHAEPPEQFAKFLTTKVQSNLTGSEVRTIVEQGPKENRICLTFLGDGYTVQEKEKFFNDIKLMVDDLFQGKTFSSYRALFNVYAVFTPSNQSGITDQARKDTVFGLYRSPAGSKRAIMPGNQRAIENAIAMAPKTDYPIIIANDEYYGGLGGRYAITTSSRQSGKIVLRHELGHNFGAVGEEYDGGSVYSGANSSRSTNIPWKHWLSDSQTKIENDMRFLGGAYVWKNLSQGPVKLEFNFPGPNQKGNFWFDVQVSSVGWQELSDVDILLDGEPLVLTGVGTSDRSFFSTEKVQNLTPGKHVLEIKEKKKDGDNILAFANVYAYEPDYDFTGGMGAFKTYDTNNTLSYRPTHQQCIMRDMLVDNFCSVDQENMWFQFFNRVKLIDNVVVDENFITLNAQKLQGLTVKWFEVQDFGPSRELEQLRDQLKVEKFYFDSGKYKVQVELRNNEIRKNLDQFVDEEKFQIQ